MVDEESRLYLGFMFNNDVKDKRASGGVKWPIWLEAVNNTILCLSPETQLRMRFDVDDIVVVGRREAEANEWVEEVLQQLDSQGMINVNFEKSVLEAAQTIFLVFQLIMGRSRFHFEASTS